MGRHLGLWGPGRSTGAGAGGCSLILFGVVCFFFLYLDAVLHLHVSQQLAVDAEEAEVALVVVDHAVPLRGRLDETWTRAALWTLQGAQQVPVHGVDQTGPLWTNIASQCRVKLADSQRYCRQIKRCFFFCLYFGHR